MARKFSEAGPSFLLRSFYFHEVTSHKSNLKLVPGTLSSLDCEADAPKVETTPPPVAPPVAPPDLPSAPAAAVPAPVTAPAEPKPDEPAEPDKPDKPETVPAVDVPEQSLQSEAICTTETLG